MNIKYKVLVASLVTVFVLPFVASAQTMTTAQLQAEIQQLLAQVQALEQQLRAQGGSATWCYTFNTNLRIGMSSADVTALQTALQKDGESVQITGAFDDQTASAVTGFQEKYASDILTPNGLQYGTGYAGVSTRAKLNALFGCGVASSPITPIQPPSMGTSPSSVNVSVSPATLNFSVNQGSYQSNYLTFSVSPNQSVNWIAQPSASWIVVSPSGSAQTTGTTGIGINSSAANLAPGNYTGTITFSPVQGSNVTFTPQTVTINVTVVAISQPPASAPSPSISPSSFNFSTQQGGSNPQSQTLNITPSLPLGWQLSSSCTASPCGWFSVGSLLTSQIPLSVNASGLAAGTYQGNIKVLDSNYNVYQTIPVTLTITNSTTQTNTLQVVSPNGGETWQLGSSQTITWDAPYVGFTAKISLISASNSAASWPILYSSAGYAGANTVSYSVGEGGSISSGSYLIQICDNNSPTNCATSAAPFTITANASFPSVTVTSPSGGVSWQAGSQHQITWTKSGTFPSGILQSADLWNNGQFVSRLYTSSLDSADMQYQWNIPTTLVPGNNYFIKFYVYTAAGVSIAQSQSAPFSVIAATPTPAFSITLDPSSSQGGTVYTGATVPILTFDIQNSSNEDIKISSVKINENVSPDSAPAQFNSIAFSDVASGVTLGQAGSLQSSGSGVYSTTFYFSTPFTVSANSHHAYAIGGASVPQYAANPAIVGTTGTFWIPANGVTAIGAISNIAATQSGSVTGSTMTIARGQ